MAREVKQRKASRATVEVNDSPRSLNVTASQAVVAEESGLGRLAGALNIADSILGTVTKDYREGERERLDLEGKQYGIDVAVGMRDAYERTWKSRDDTADQIDGFYNDALAKLPDNQMRRAAVAYMDQARADLLVKHGTFVREQDRIRKIDSLGAVFDETAINGGGLGKNGMAHFMEYGRTQGLTNRELGAIAVERAILFAQATGNASVLDDVERHVVDDVPLGTVHKGDIQKARTQAAAVRNKVWTDEKVRRIAALNDTAKAGNFTGTDEQLAEARELGLSQSEVISLMNTTMTASASGMTKEAIKAAYHASVTETINGTPQRNYFAQAPNGKDKNDAVRELYSEAQQAGNAEEMIRIAKTTGIANDTWTHMLGNTALSTPDTWDGNVPGEFLQRYELYKTLRTEPGVLGLHLKDGASKDFFYAYDVATETLDSPEEAYAAALQITNDPESIKFMQRVDQRELASSINSIVSKGRNRPEDESYVYSKIYKYAEHNIRKGASLERALEDAEDDFIAAHTKINGAWVYTGGRPVPANIDELREFIIEEDHFAALEARGVDTEDLDPDDFTIIPDIRGRAGIWQVISSTDRVPTTTLVDMQSAQQRLLDRQHPRITPSQWIEHQQRLTGSDLLGFTFGENAANLEFIERTTEELEDFMPPFIDPIDGQTKPSPSMVDGLRSRYNEFLNWIGNGTSKAAEAVVPAAEAADAPPRIPTKQSVQEELVTGGVKVADSKVFVDYLIDQEGAVRVDGKHVVYDDATGQPIPPGTKPIGNPTIGYGHLVKKGESFESMTEEEARALLKKDIQIHTEAAQKFVDRKYGKGTFESLPGNLQAALVDMDFNPGLKKFPKFTDAVVNGNLETARRESKRFTNGKPLGKRNRGILKFLN